MSHAQALAGRVGTVGAIASAAPGMDWNQEIMSQPGIAKLRPPLRASGMAGGRNGASEMRKAVLQALGGAEPLLRTLFGFHAVSDTLSSPASKQTSGLRD